MRRGPRRWLRVGVMAVSMAAYLNVDAAAGRKQTFSGEIGDAMCGRKHVEGTAAECTRSCVGHGSKFTLVMGEKIYILEAADKATLTALETLAGRQVTVTGVLEGETVAVSSVAAK